MPGTRAFPSSPTTQTTAPMFKSKTRSRTFTGNLLTWLHIGQKEATMAADSSQRISRLSKRFTTHAAGRRRDNERMRERRSFYLDAELVSQMDRVYRELNHALFPKQISKSLFLETIIERGIRD